MKQFVNKTIYFKFFIVTLLFIVLCIVGCSKKDKDELKIGCITILSGEVATYGKETKQGVDLAIEQANNSGMLGSKKIKVVYEDSQIDAKVGT